VIPFFIFPIILFTAFSRALASGFPRPACGVARVVAERVSHIGIAGLMTTLVVTLRAFLSSRHPDSR